MLVSVMSDSLQPRGLWPARLLCPGGSPGKNAGGGCLPLLQVPPDRSLDLGPWKTLVRTDNAWIQLTGLSHRLTQLESAGVSKSRGFETRVHIPLWYLVILQEVIWSWLIQRKLMSRSVPSIYTFLKLTSPRTCLWLTGSVFSHSHFLQSPSPHHRKEMHIPHPPESHHRTILESLASMRAG